MRNWIIVGLSLFLAFYFAQGGSGPDQIHLSLTGTASEMTISWVTKDDTKTTTVQYGKTKDLGSSATGKIQHYDMVVYYSPAIHYVKLTGLEPNTEYFYKVGDETDGWSAIYSFKTANPKDPSPDDPLNILVLADNGVSDNSKMVINSAEGVDKKLGFEMTLLSGDLSYANLDQSKWDEWGNQIQGMASRFPWMFAPGNHEAIGLFIPYNNRFFMPTNGYDNLYFSFNYRNVHVVALNSESLNEFHFSEMYRFFDKDIKAVDRSVTPWVVVMFHHPFYCSNTKHNDSAWFMKAEYEKTFYEQGVDIVLQGHVHAYERTLATYDWKPNPKGPFYMTDGMAGNHEGLYKHWQDPQPAWSAFRIAEYGFSTLAIHNSTHAHWQMYRANDTTVLDDAWLVRDRSALSP